MDNILPIRLFRKQAPITSRERNNRGNNFGECTPDRLTGILANSKAGNIDEWIELCEYARETDGHLDSLITTLESSVIEKRYEILPGISIDPNENAQSIAATDFCRAVLSEIPDFTTKMKSILGAIGCGISTHAKIWGRRYGANVITDLEWVHARRFRWDEQWKLCLYDGGEYSSYSPWGKPIEQDKDLWLVHLAKGATYPGQYGAIRPCIWPWNFKMWVNRYYIHATERYGQPFTTATVPQNSPAATHTSVLRKLEQLSYDTVGVFEEGTKVVFEGGPSTMNNGDMFRYYLDRADQQQTKSALGATDIVDPGVHGSQSAVETREDATLDPRTKVNLEQFANTIESQIFEPLIRLNRHKWNGVIPPTPKFVFEGMDKPKPVVNTARTPEVSSDDTQVIDHPQEQTESTGQESQTIQETSLNGAQIISLLEIITSISTGNLPRSSGVFLISTAFNFSTAQAEQIVGDVGRGFVPANPESSQTVIANARTVETKGLKKKALRTTSANGSSQIRQISLPLSSPLATVLSSVSDD